MDKYKLLQRLGKGGQGSVFLVKSKSDNKEYVLKKIECNDEVEANRAFKEVLALKELQNTYICGYKDFFVMWDKQESAMFVCIIMMYYEMGDLGKVLSQKKNERVFIEEQMIEKWIAQMLIALEFVHKNRVIHRDLKPSNVFLTDDLDIRIGDFGVATIMADVNAQTRTAVGSTYWMAPEVAERNYDERSDVWSMGCIILEMAVCGLLDSDAIWQLLLDIKNETEKLDDAIEKLTKHSHGLGNFVKKALQQDCKVRPFINELMEDNYAKECIILLHSSLPMENKGETTVTPPKEKGTEGIISFMKDCKDNKQQLIMGLDSISEVVKTGNGKPLVIEEVEFIVKILQQYRKSKDVMKSGFNLLSISLTVQPFENTAIHEALIVPLIIKGMQDHKSEEDCILAATQLLMILSTDEGLAKLIGELGGVQDIIEAFERFPDNIQLTINCCRAIWSLSINEHNSKMIGQEKGASIICNALKKHHHDAYLTEVALAALWCLSIEDENVELMVKEKALSIILKSIQKHQNNFVILKNALMALASLAEADESSAYELVTDDHSHYPQSNGMDIILDSIKPHQCNEDVIDTFCSLVTELAAYDDIRNDLRSKHVKQLLTELKTWFPLNAELARSIDDTVRTLDNITYINPH